MTIAITRRTVGALLTAATLPARADIATPDPVLAAIQAVRVAKAELHAAVLAMDDRDHASVLAAYGASDRNSEARHALSRALPTTRPGLRALVRFHAADLMGAEPDSYGALALKDLVRAVDALLEAPASPD